jgi:selenocysteine-specific elongation factor
VLDVQPPELPRRPSARERAAELAELAQSGPTRRADAVLRRHRFLVVPTFRRMGLPVVGAEIGRLRADPDVWLAARDRAPSVVATWSAAHPLADGMPLDVLRQALDLPDLDVTQRLVAITRLSLVAGMVRAGTAPELPARVADAVAELARGWASAPFVAPEAGRLARLGLGRRELAAAARAGRLTRVAEGVVLVPDAPARAARLLATLAQPFTVSQARRCLGTTRRVAVPLLELLDRHGVTERFPDDTRRLV